jgi:hypothetical protein
MKRHWLLAGVLVPLAAGCAHTGRLTYVPSTIAPTKTHVAGSRLPAEDAENTLGPVRLLFGDTLIGLVPGTADSSRRLAACVTATPPTR